jgi:acetylornithine deacetylase or succinyl-diaminopimelate desuccinylase
MDKEIVDLTVNLVKIPTLNPPGSNMNEAANFIVDWFKNRGIEANIKEYEKGWPTVVAEVGNKRSNRSIMLNGHFDVVPTGDERSWKFPPFGGVIADNKIYGRGTTDMKSGVALAMYLAYELADKVDYKLIFSAVSDEETGGFRCAKHLAEEYNFDFAIIPEPSGPSSLIIGEKGLMQVRLISKGIPAHGSLPSLGENAISKMILDLMNLSNISKVEVEIPNELKDVINETKKELLKEYEKPIEDFKDVERISFNIGVIKGGVKVNVVADYCEAEIDMRIPPGIKFEEAFNHVKSLVKNSEINVIQSSQPNYSSPNNAFIRNFSNTANKILGSSKFMLIPGATDGRYFRSKGKPVLIYGPGSLAIAHKYDEYVEIENIEKCYRTLKNFLEKPF